MTGSACQRWIALSDRLALNEPLSLDEQAFQREHEMQCADCRAEARVWDALGRARSDAGALSEAGAWFSGRGAAPRQKAAISSKLWRARSAIALGALTLAAIAAATPLGLRLLKRTPPAPSPTPVALVLASGNVELDARSVTAGSALAVEQTLRVGDGRACLRLEPGIVTCVAASSAMRVTSTSAQDRALSLISGTALAKLERQPPGSTFRIDTSRGSAIAKGTIFSVQIATGDRVFVRVQEGTVVFRKPDGGEVRLVAPVQASIGSQVEMTPLTASAQDDALLLLTRLSPPLAKSRLDVSSTPAGATVTLDGVELGFSPVSALVGGGQRLSLTHPGYSPVSERVWLGGEERVARSYDLVPTPEPTQRVEREPALDASARAALGPTARAPSPSGDPGGPSAEELLSRARSLRASGRSLDAASAYRRVIASWPRSPEARVGLISLGELELSELSEPAAALREFTAYLRIHGTLAPEARYGRIRALGRLGRHSEELTEARDFVRDYPSSVQASDLRARLGL
jgi:hypothetical protein